MQFAWKDTTAEHYWDKLDVLPPAYHSFYGFLVGEPMTRRICSISGRYAETYTAFRSVGQTYAKCAEPLTIAEFKQEMARLHAADKGGRSVEPG